MRRIVLCLLVSAAACGAVGAAAQDESPEALYKAVEAYPADQRAEMRAKGKMPDRDDMENIERGQKELAARSAAKLAARTDLKGLDLFYLGALYNLAGKKKETLDAMRRYLADAAAEGAHAQVARNLVAVYAAQNKLFDEAEAAREAGEERTILFGLCGHGNFDLAAYDAYLAGELEDPEFSEEDMRAALERLPEAPAIA